jgi:Holliday junction resolvase RusA-like endonuclease
VEITVEIPGDAVPQPRARSTRGGRMYTPDNGIVAFKQAVALLVTAEARRKRVAVSDADAFVLEVVCVFGRPPSHQKASGGLRRGAPRFPKRVGDWDNLAKGVADAITKAGVIWKDDDQVVSGSCYKRYAARGEPSKTMVLISSVTP